LPTLIFKKEVRFCFLTFEKEAYFIDATFEEEVNSGNGAPNMLLYFRAQFDFFMKLRCA
jgi:hypothetical protein